MTFDLAGWLIGLLADAGRRRLTTFVLGSEQERALRSAAKVAIRLTAEELPSGDEAQVELVINQVFSKPMPSAPPAKHRTILDALQAGIAGQLAVLDDAGLTGTGQSSADVLGTPGAVLADKLTEHLVREIIVRGSGGGPLTPLADQFNHELTRLQGQRIEGMLARLAREIQDAVARPGSGAMVAGRPLEEVADPFALEVHRPVQPEDAPPGLPLLPPYMPREHDQMLGQVVAAAADGRSGIAVLVGGSSTGKTRACWEALAPLRDQDPPWRLWHPIDPTRPDAALRELAGIGPRTVVWLNEAQFYLDPAEAGLGERVAAGLRELLRDPGRPPVLVLATLWAQFWDTLTVRPGSGEDRHAQARDLLAGHDITVPAAFTPAQMSQLAEADDARMALAARSARDGEVIQFLAGAPELLARYRNAPPAAKALIDAAMDARRLGMGAGLPRAFLEAAAPGYLTDHQWDALGEDWLEQALAYAAVPCKGARGPLTRPRPARHTARTRRDQPASMTAVAGPLYRLADYLDQHGRAHRAGQIPPAEFWSAAAAHAPPADQAALGDAADARGLYRDAAQLHKNAAASGNTHSAFYLSEPTAFLRADPRPAHWAAVHVALDKPDTVSLLLGSLRAAGVAAALLARDPATHAALHDPGGVASLLGSLRRAGAHEQAAALLARDPAARAALDDPYGVASLLDSLREEGAHEQAAALLARDPAARAALDDPYGVAVLLNSMRRAGAHEQTAALADRAAAHAPLDDPGRVMDRVAPLLESMRQAGAHEQAAALADRAAARAALHDPSAVALQLDRLRAAGAHQQVTALADRAAAHAALDDPGGVARLMGSLRRAGAHEQVVALLARDPATHAALHDPYGVASLLGSLQWADEWQRAGAHEQVTALADRAAAHAPLDDPGAVASLLDSLREAGAHEQAAALLARDPAAHAALDDPQGVASLLDSLREAGAREQTAALLARDPAAHAALHDPYGVASLLASLRAVGAHEQTAVLTGRLPTANMFGLFLELQGPADRFRFGREADGTPAAPWGWEDLDLCLVVPPRAGTVRRLCSSACRRPAEFAR